MKPSIDDIGKAALKSKSTNFDWVQNGTRAMIDLWMYNFARNVSYILDGDSAKSLSVFKNKQKKKPLERDFYLLLFVLF